MFRVFEKLKHSRVSLIAWSSLKFGNFADQIKGKREQLQRSVIDNPPGHSKNIMELQDDINLLLEQEEVFWRQRSHVSWLKEGDKNTKKFHAQCNQRRKTNLISGLQDDDGVWHTDQSKISELAIAYFKNIFTSTQPTNENINMCLRGMDQKVTDAMNRELLSEYTVEEVHQALKQMYPTKAPGPDGMSAIFYQSY